MSKPLIPQEIHFANWTNWHVHISTMQNYVKNAWKYTMLTIELYEHKLVSGGSCHIEFYRVIYELCDQTPARMKLWSASIYASPKWPNKVNCQRSLRNWNHFSKDSKRPAVENKGQSRVIHDYMVKNSETILKNPLHLKWKSTKVWY